MPKTAVINLLKKDFHAEMGNGDFCLCKNPSCQVVYYQAGTGKVFEVDSLKVKVWLKDQGDDVPLCYCHNVTRGQIKTAWRNGAKTFAEIAKTTGVSKDGCNCKVNNPSGKCCFAAIKQYIDELASGLGATLELE